MFDGLSKWALALTILATTVAVPAEAGIKVYEKDDKYVEIGGRLQLQYMMIDPEGGDSEDDVFFRRLRPYIAGSVTKNWEGKFQFDLGKAVDGGEVAVKDAYMRYKSAHGLKVTVGNSKTPFSREFLTSSKRQQMVERSFVGDHNYGSPDRMLGVNLAGKSGNKKVTWGAAFGSESVDPDARKLDFDTPVNRNCDFNEGWVVAGRVDFHPKGEMKFDQGDFGRDGKFTIGLGAYSWSNDDDNNTYTTGGISTSSSKADIDSANGLELSFGYGAGGFSVDAQYNLVSADTVDSTFTGGLYRSGTTDLDTFAIEAGYMVAAKQFELVAGYESLDADGYADAWNRTSFGVNYFVNKHKVKSQLTYRIGENLNGVADNDANEIFLQFQYVF